MSHQYFFRIFDPFGGHIADLGDVVFADWARVENTIGLMQLTLAGCDAHDLGFTLQPDLRVEVWHQPPGQAPRLDGDTVWFLRRWEYNWDRNSKTTDLYLYDTIHLLSRRIVAWETTDNPQSPSHMGGAGAVGQGNDTQRMLYRVVNYNFGPWVNNYLSDPDVTVPGVVPPAAGGGGTGLPFTSAERQMALLDTAVDSGRSGVGATHEMSWANCLDVLQTIAEDTQAQGVPLTFDIVYDPIAQSFSFRSWSGIRGADLADEITFSPANQNVTDFTEVHDWEEVADWAYVGGGDTGAGRLVQGVANWPQGFQRSPWGATEIFVDGGDVVDQDALDAEGRAALWQYRPRVTFTGVAQDTADAIWGVHYGYGDRVRVSGVTTATARLRRYGVNLQGNVATVDIPLESEDDVITPVTS